MSSNVLPANGCDGLPIFNPEILSLILDHFKPSREEYAVRHPWKQRAQDSTLVSLTQVCRQTRRIALPIVWAYVYVETMKDWGLLWKRISPESGQHIKGFFNFWVIAHLPPMAIDKLERMGKDLLWYAFINRKTNYEIGHKVDTYNPYKDLGNGPDGHGPDSIITCRNDFLQACNDVSSTWSRKLLTIYWDASTSFPEQLILNIRTIQETEARDVTQYIGLQNLWIDFFEERSREYACDRYRIRSSAVFWEPLWKLGHVTLKNLKFFSLASPFWPEPIVHFTKPKREDESQSRRNEIPPIASEDSCPAQLMSFLKFIQPEIFFGISQAPFECKQLLPSWANLRCLHIFSLVTMTNDDCSVGFNLDRTSTFFRRKSMPGTRICRGGELTPSEYIDQISELIRAAIQLRPTLQRLYRAKNSQPLTGEDILNYVNSTQEDWQNWSVTWTEDWRYKFYCGSEYRDPQQIIAEDLCSTYKEWLSDPELACRVARSFNEGNKEDNVASYPFRHPEYAGKLYFETSSCHCPGEAIWLDRPGFRGSYSKLNIEGISPRNKNPAGMQCRCSVERAFPNYRVSL